MTEPLQVSIIVNNYNYGEFLAEAIDSALAQTYPFVEVIVVDDGSTDHSPQVIRSYGRRIVSVFKSNGGQASAYNAGFAVSRGNAICFLDSDDTLFPHAVERAIPIISQPRPAKVQWPLVVTGADGRATGELSIKRAPPEGDLSKMVTRDGPFYDFHLHTGALYPRWFLQEVFPVPEPPYRNGADVYLITLAPIFGDVVNISEPLGVYRNHGRNNYCGRAMDDERLRDCIRRFEVNCSELAKYLRLQGREANLENWKRRNFNYQWPSRLLQAKEDIARLVPEGADYILIGGDEWGERQPVPGRHAIPFLEAEGEYAGPPADDNHAIRELERLRMNGASALVVWWTSFWWMDHYPAFARHLRERFPCLLDREHLLVFDLKRLRKPVASVSDNNATATQKELRQSAALCHKT